MRITTEYFEKILNKISHNRSDLQIANFGFDDLETDRIAQLLTALDRNNTVHTLDLSVNFLQSEAISYLSAYLTTHHSIEKLELRGNHMGDENARPLLQALCENCGVKILDLKDNCLSDAIIPDIKQLLRRNSTLQLINLTFNNFSKAGIQELLEIVNIYCLLQLDSKDREYLRVIKAAKYKIKLLFKLQMYIRYVLYDNEKYSGEAKAAKKTALWQSLGDVCWNLINKHEDTYEPIEFFISLIKSSFETDDFHDPISLIQQCIESHSLISLLLYAVIALPDSDSRNEILHTIGDALFCTEKNCSKSMLNLVYAHVCFLNISTKTYAQSRMLLESYRSLVSALGLGNYDLDLDRWKGYYNQNNIIGNFENILARIDTLIDRKNKQLHSSPSIGMEEGNGLLTILFSHRCKVAAQLEIPKIRPALTM